MFTTAPLMRSATSAKLTTVGSAATAPARVTSVARANVRGAVATMGDGMNSPAMMRPTRNATAAQRATVTTVKRFDVASVHYKCPELIFGQRLNPERPGFLELGARILANDEVRGLSAD